MAALKSERDLIKNRVYDPLDLPEFQGRVLKSQTFYEFRSEHEDNYRLSPPKHKCFQPPYGGISRPPLAGPVLSVRPSEAGGRLEQRKLGLCNRDVVGPWHM